MNIIMGPHTMGSCIRVTKPKYCVPKRGFSILSRRDKFLGENDCKKSIHKNDDRFLLHVPLKPLTAHLLLFY